MSKPEFMKPFNIEHAKTGSPYCCRNGEEATILKFGIRDKDYPLVGIRGSEDVLETWRLDGHSLYDTPHKHDLVMVPLGFIDGKPVFVGDEYLGHADCKCIAGAHLKSDFSGCKWPPAAPKWPQTTMTDGALEVAHLSVLGASAGRRAIANATIAHECSTGALVPADKVREIEAKAREEGVKEGVSEAMKFSSEFAREIAWRALQANDIFPTSGDLDSLMPMVYP